jgi:hypothetical protein
VAEEKGILINKYKNLYSRVKALSFDKISSAKNSRKIFWCYSRACLSQTSTFTDVIKDVNIFFCGCFSEQYTEKVLMTLDCTYPAL